MPVPFDIDKAPQENVWYVHQNEICSNFTGSTLYSINYLNEQFFNSNLSEGFYRNHLMLPLHIIIYLIRNS